MSTSGTKALRTVLEQNGLINLFALAFALLLWARNRYGYHERLLVLTSTASLIADVLLVFTNGPSGIAVTDMPSIQAMTFFEVLCWTTREVGLTLYTNRLVTVLDTRHQEQLYRRVFWSMVGVLVAWRTADLCLRTYDPTAQEIAGTIVRLCDPYYLGMLSVVEMWSAIFLVRVTAKHLAQAIRETNMYLFARRIIATGILRVVTINMIPMIRLIMNQSGLSSFDYGADASAIIYELMVAMNLMYLIDLAVVKLDSDSVFRPRSERGTGAGSRHSPSSIPKISISAASETNVAQGATEVVKRSQSIKTVSEI
ncbi:hypothetical protein RI367_006455 [Sorochytrium milnesiophthora]